MTEPIKDPIVHKVEVRRRLPASEQLSAEQARKAAAEVYRAFGIETLRVTMPNIKVQTWTA